MPEWIKQNLPVAVLFVVGCYVGLQTLEVKFDYAEQRAAERFRMLQEIQATGKDNTAQLSKLRSEYASLTMRFERIEDYVPQRINSLEREVLAVQKDLNMVNYKLEKESL